MSSPANWVDATQQQQQQPGQQLASRLVTAMSCCETLTSESDCKCSGEIELAWAFPVSCVVPKRLEAVPWDEISSNILDKLSSISPEGSVSILTADFNSPGIRPLAETSICCCSAQFCSCPAKPPGGEFWSMVGCSSSQSPPKPNNLFSWSSKLACGSQKSTPRNALIGYGTATVNVLIQHLIFQTRRGHINWGSMPHRHRFVCMSNARLDWMESTYISRYP